MADDQGTRIRPSSDLPARGRVLHEDRRVSGEGTGTAPGGGGGGCGWVAAVVMCPTVAALWAGFFYEV